LKGKQISVSIVQENRYAHKLQANYNIIIIIKKKKPTRCRDELEVELESCSSKSHLFFYLPSVM
jgi:hypothetical protein